MKVNSSAAINLIAQQLSFNICPFWASLPCVVSKFCSQQDLTKIPIKSDTEQKAYDTYAANGIKENVVSDSYETICILSSKAMTL